MRKFFEDWFENSLLKNLPQDRKVLIVMDNNKYHNRLSEKTPTKSMKKNQKTKKKTKKNDMISFITKHHIEISSPYPVKPVLLEKICEANIPKKYVIDDTATAAGYSVDCLPPYHCVFNQIEMVWNQLKHHA